MIGYLKPGSSEHAGVVSGANHHPRYATASKIDSDSCNGSSELDIFSGVVYLPAIPESNLHALTRVTLNIFWLTISDE